MTAGDLDHIRSRLREAEEGIREGEVLLQHGLLRAAVSRLYYACFHATEALLWTENLHSKKHTGIRSLFERHWILAGRLPNEMGQFYRELLDNRHDADYRVADFEREQVETWLDEARRFVGALTSEAQRKLEDKPPIT